MAEYSCAVFGKEKGRKTLDLSFRLRLHPKDSRPASARRMPSVLCAAYRNRGLFSRFRQTANAFPSRICTFSVSFWVLPVKTFLPESPHIFQSGAGGRLPRGGARGAAEFPSSPFRATRKAGGRRFVAKSLPSACVLAPPIFPVRLRTSIVGRSELNFRVRNGNGWTLALIGTN